jgi:hypothetical protein
MEWRHKCSLDWLKKRQRYLTASDIRALVPMTKTGRKRKVTKMDMLKVYASKKVELTERDCWSYGAAARGHLLEPYAVDALNDRLIMDGATRQMYFHWDDELITLTGRRIAFSPDAMDIPQIVNHREPRRIAEIKCYSPERHIETAYRKADEIEERWQIATAMALLDTIEFAYLVLFNPSLYIDRLVLIPYNRNDLQWEIEMVLKVERDWEDFLRSMPLMPLDGRLASLDGLDESDIVDELERAQALNPV